MYVCIWWIGSYLIMLANNALVKDRHDCVVKGLLFLYHYINLRRDHAKRLKGSATTTTASAQAEQPSSSSSSSSSSLSSEVEFISELGLRQETHYNLGVYCFVIQYVCMYV